MRRKNKFQEIFLEFNPQLKETIRKNIRKARIARGYTQEQLALSAEISYDFMRRIESEKVQSGYSVETLYKIASVLDESIDDLMERNIKSNTPKES